MNTLFNRMHIIILTLLNRTQIFRYSDALCSFLMLSAFFFSEKDFPTLAALIIVSNITSTTIYTLRCMKATSRILQFFCYDYFEDVLAPITFAQNFGFLAGVVSKIFATENALQSKNQFLRDAFRKSYLLRNLTITIAHKNFIL